MDVISLSAEQSEPDLQKELDSSLKAKMKVFAAVLALSTVALASGKNFEVLSVFLVVERFSVFWGK